MARLTMPECTLPLSFYILGPAASIIYWFVWIIYARTFHPLAKYPGPFLASISRLWLVTEQMGGGIEKTTLRLHEKHGTFVRIAPNELLISDPDAIKIIYSTNAGFTKTDFYLVYRAKMSRYPDTFTELDESMHSRRRKIVNNVYSMTSIARAEESIDATTSMLLSRMKDQASAGKVFDLANWVQWYAFDSIGMLYFGHMFGFLETGSDFSGHISALDQFLPVLTAAAVMPKYMRPLFLLSGALVPRIFKAIRFAGQIQQAGIDAADTRSAALAEGKDVDKKDILSGLFDIMHEKGEKLDFGLSEVKTEAWVAFIAGSDTTAAGLSSILYNLIKHPPALRTLLNELETHIPHSSSSTDPKFISYAKASTLPYLAACIKEGLRLHPSIGLHLPRHVPPSGCIISGQRFPGGTRVGINAKVIHHDKSVFGEDADEFVPERWFRDPAVVSRMERCMFHFGGGSRTCIGKNIALCSIYKMVPQLLRDFEFEFEDGKGKGMKTSNFWFNKMSGIMVRVRAREE